MHREELYNFGLNDQQINLYFPKPSIKKENIYDSKDKISKTINVEVFDKISTMKILNNLKNYTNIFIK